MTIQSFLLYKHLLAVYNVNAGSSNLLKLAACEVIDSFHISVFTFHLANACFRIAYLEHNIDNCTTVLLEITELTIGITLWINATPVLLEAETVYTVLGRCCKFRN